MGFKLAGFDVVGCVEIDKRMLDMYRANLAPKHPFLMPIQDFNKIPVEDLPADVRAIDVLDGSPPCSVFSMAGNRAADWGKERKFTEGQAVQTLDDLFFHFIETARRLQPRVVVAENVKGLVIGHARGYVKEIFKGFAKAGYRTRLFMLNARNMGVPQSRTRVFFICERMDLKPLDLDMVFNEEDITPREAWAGLPEPTESLTVTGKKLVRYWHKTIPGHNFSEAAGMRDGDTGTTNFTNYRLSFNKTAPTVTSSGPFLHPSVCRRLSSQEFVRLQSFPEDYRFTDKSAQYVCGMSVPPLMMQRIALRIAEKMR
jgi:DNA (cytosine-5)-methyltransferase 1